VGCAVTMLFGFLYACRYTAGVCMINLVMYVHLEPCL
jgi:hypothetical protein